MRPKMCIRDRDEGLILTDKPVDMAVQDFVQGKYFLIEPDYVPEEVNE